MVLCAIFSFFMAATLVYIHSGPWRAVWIGGVGILWALAAAVPVACLMMAGLAAVACVKVRG